MTETAYLDQLQWKEHHQVYKMLVHSRIKQSSKSMWSFHNRFFKAQYQWSLASVTQVCLILQCTKKKTTDFPVAVSCHWESLWLSDFILLSQVLVPTLRRTRHTHGELLCCAVWFHIRLPTTLFFKNSQDWGCGSDSSTAASCWSCRELQGTTRLATTFIFLIYFMKTRKLKSEMQGFVMNSLEKPFPGILYSPKPKPCRFPLPLDGSL